MPEELTVKLIKVLCPYLKKMAGDTKDPINKLVVDIICTLVMGNDEKVSS